MYMVQCPPINFLLIQPWGTAALFDFRKKLELEAVFASALQCSSVSGAIQSK